MKSKLIIIFLLGCIYISLYGQKEINPNGYNKIFYPNGSLQSEGRLVNGKPEGYWRNYYPTGVLKSEGSRKNHLLDSIWIFYSITGDTISKINYLNGKKNGYSIEFFSNVKNPLNKHNIYLKELYVNNKKEGKSYYYYEDGKIKEVCNYENNLKEGEAIEYAEDGRIITIKKYRKGTLVDREKVNRFTDDKKKDKVWKEYYSDGKLKTESYFKNGVLDGYYKEYDVKGSLVLTLLYRDGRLIQDVTEEQIESKEKIEYFDDGTVKATGFYNDMDKPIGLHKKYTKEDSLIKATIYNDNSIIVSAGNVDDDGRRIGQWVEYYESGKVKSKGNYNKNARNGKWIFYMENGNIEQEGEYTKGKINGLWTFYYDNGKVWKEEEYFNGLAEGAYSEYDTLGNLIVNGEYFDGEKEGEWIVKINDHKAVGKFVTGLMDGKWKYFYEDGSLHFEGNFVQGNPDGKHKYYYPNGNLKEEQFYSSGIKQKHWKKYSDDGQLEITITYDNDREYRINGVKVDFPLDLPLVIE